MQARRPIPNFAYIVNSFTWSKAIDIASGHMETANGDNSRVNFANPNNDKGVSSYDQPFNDTVSIVWDTPYGRGRRWGANVNPFVEAVLGDWQISLINTMTSGLPINLTYDPTSQFQVSTAPNYANVSGDPP